MGVIIQLLQLTISSVLLCSVEAPSLYTVLPEKSSAVGSAMMGSSHVYDMAAVRTSSSNTNSSSSSSSCTVMLHEMFESFYCFN